MDLTGDEFYTKDDALSDDELIAALPRE